MARQKEIVLTEEEKARFLERQREVGNGCIDAYGTCTAEGAHYIALRRGKAPLTVPIERMAWICAHGEDIAKGEYLHKRCMNELCVNIDHIYVDTYITEFDRAIAETPGQHWPKSKRGWSFAGRRKL